MNEEEISAYIDTSGYLESLIKSWKMTVELVSSDHVVYTKMVSLIELELDLALMAAEKAKSEVLKKSKDNIKPIKGD